MIARAKTIQIFLPSGDPQGIRQAEITTRIAAYEMAYRIADQRSGSDGRGKRARVDS